MPPAALSRLRRISPRSLCAAFLVFVAIFALVGAGTSEASFSAQPALVVRTATGLVQGKAAASMDEYLGVPYAAPPVGALRWQPPKAPASWKGVRQATSFAPHCPQPGSFFGVASRSENCLYLNVYAPARSTGRDLPVMVWVHGGSLLVGESNDYNPAALVKHGVIVVTINYRLGALGFLADSALASRPGGPSGDYGLQDQQAALRWVQGNIHAFDGNPHNVTLFGESAGGLSVLSQLASPSARGLFQRAIVESGTYNLTQQSQASADTAGATFAASVGCASNTAACLRSLPVSTIIDHENLLYDPSIDAAVLPESIKTALASGRFTHVPVLIGTNHDEYRLFVGVDALIGAPVTAANYQSMIASTLGVPAATAATIAAKYPLSAYSSPSTAFGAVGTDAIFACPALTAEGLLSRYTPTYAYEFNDENAPELYLASAGFPYGAAHGSEIQYLFDVSDAPHPAPLTKSQQRLAKAMQSYWTNLAKFDRPDARWPRFTSKTARTLSLVPPSAKIETNYAAEHKCGFWATVS